MLIVAGVFIFYLAIAYLGAFFQLVMALRWSISLATWDRGEDYERLLTTDFTPPISFIVPVGAEAGPEQAEFVDRLLSLRYPSFEVILVKDGVSEEVPAVTGAFFMKSVDLRFRRVLPAGEILSLYRSDDAKLTLAEKEPGAWGDAANCGLNLARYPLVCLLEPSALPHPENLLRLVKVLMETRRPIFRVSGLTQAVNGLQLEGLKPREERLPAGRMLRLFIAERLVAQAGPAGGLRRVAALPLPPQPLSIYHRRELQDAGGFDSALDRQAGEADLYVRAYVKARQAKREVGSFLLQGPASLGILPETLGGQLSSVRQEQACVGRAVARRRRELSRVIAPADRFLAAFRRGFLQPAGLAELLGYLVLIPATVARALDPAILGIYLAVALGLPALTSAISVLAVQVSFPLYAGAGFPLQLYALASNLGYRQIVAVNLGWGAWRASQRRMGKRAGSSQSVRGQA